MIVDKSVGGRVDVEVFLNRPRVAGALTSEALATSMPNIWMIMRLLQEQLGLLYLWRIENIKLLLKVLRTCNKQLLENDER